MPNTARKLALDHDAPVQTVATITALARQWDDAQARADVALGQVNAAEHAAFALHPDIPEIVRDERGDMLSAEEIRQRDDTQRSLTWPRPTGSPRVEAAARWKAQCEAIDRSFNTPELNAALEAIYLEAERLADQIVAMPPVSAAEAALKFRVMLERFGDGHGDFDQPAKIFSFLADLEGLAAIEGGGVAPSPEPPSREVLESYSAWLFMERRLLALELYPDMDAKAAERFVPAGNAGDAWHFKGPPSWRDKPQPSTRAVFILRSLGVLPENQE